MRALPNYTPGSPGKSICGELDGTDKLRTCEFDPCGPYIYTIPRNTGTWQLTGQPERKSNRRRPSVGSASQTLTQRWAGVYCPAESQYSRSPVLWSREHRGIRIRQTGGRTPRPDLWRPDSFEVGVCRFSPCGSSWIHGRIWITRAGHIAAPRCHCWHSAARSLFGIFFRTEKYVGCRGWFRGWHSLPHPSALLWGAFSLGVVA